MATTQQTLPPLLEALPSAEDLARKGKWLTFLTHLAHRGMMLDKITKQNDVVLKAAQAHAAGETTVKPSVTAGEDEMGVSIGNEYRIIVQGTEDQKALPAAAQPAGNGMKYAAATLLGAMLGGGGLLLGSYLNNDPSIVSPVVVQQPAQEPPVVNVPPITNTDTDTNTKYKFDVGIPKDIE